MEPLGAVDFSADIYCPQCGYNLRGIASRRCPECGLEVDRAALTANRIPWEHRVTIGSVRAYVRTAWQVMKDPKQFAQSINAPVSYSAARRFWLITVVLVWLPLAGAAVAVMLLIPDRADLVSVWPELLAEGQISAAEVEIYMPLLAGALLPGVLPVALLLYLLAMTGATSYFFHPSSLAVERQNRAVAMSYYACGPLVGILPIGLVGGGSLVLVSLLPEDMFMVSAVLVLFLFLLLLVPIFAPWSTSWVLLKHATHASGGRTFFVALALPVLWAALAVLILGGLTWTAGLLWLMYLSLQ